MILLAQCELYSTIKKSYLSLKTVIFLYEELPYYTLVFFLPSHKERFANFINKKDTPFPNVTPKVPLEISKRGEAHKKQTF